MDEGNALVEKAIEEIQSTGQTKREYIEQNQILLQNLNVSHPKLDVIVNVSKGHNFGAKLTGAGGGGCAFVVIPPTATQNDVDKLKDDLKAQCPEFKFWSVPLGVPGVTISCI